MNWQPHIAWIALTTTLPAGAGWSPLPPWQHIEEVVAQRCGACHGSGGQGSNPMFPKLAGQNAGYLERQMTNFQRGVRSGPVMFYQLSDMSAQDIAALARHFAGLERRPTQASPTGAESGARLYSEPGSNGNKACAECHGSYGRGNDTMPRLAGQHAAYLADQMNRFRNGKRVAGQTPEHPRASQLSEDEVTAISQYLSSLK